MRHNYFWFTRKPHALSWWNFHLSSDKALTKKSSRYAKIFTLHREQKDEMMSLTIQLKTAWARFKPKGMVVNCQVFHPTLKSKYFPNFGEIGMPICVLKVTAYCPGICCMDLFYLLSGGHRVLFYNNELVELRGWASSFSRGSLFSVWEIDTDTTLGHVANRFGENFFRIWPE